MKRRCQSGSRVDRGMALIPEPSNSATDNPRFFPDHYTLDLGS